MADFGFIYTTNIVLIILKAILILKNLILYRCNYPVFLTRLSICILYLLILHPIVSTYIDMYLISTNKRALNPGPDQAINQGARAARARHPAKLSPGQAVSTRANGLGISVLPHQGPGTIVQIQDQDRDHNSLGTREIPPHPPNRRTGALGLVAIPLSLPGIFSSKKSGFSTPENFAADFFHC